MGHGHRQSIENEAFDGITRRIYALRQGFFFFGLPCP
jgi:hypothetical protein